MPETNEKNDKNILKAAWKVFHFEINFNLFDFLNFGAVIYKKWPLLVLQQLRFSGQEVKCYQILSLKSSQIRAKTTTFQTILIEKISVHLKIDIETVIACFMCQKSNRYYIAFSYFLVIV